MNSPLSIVLAGGGTAGHVSPMIAMARALQRADPRTRITMIGTADGMETELVPAAGFELTTIDRVPMPRRPNADLFKLPVSLRRAVRQAKAIIDDVGADVVVGVGGYVATPVYLAARDIPVVVHEGNVRPGLANRVGARRAQVVATAFPETRLAHAQHVGMPLRRQITALDRTPQAQAEARRSLGLAPDRTTLVVTGGSSGALNLNRTIGASVPQLLATGAQVLHLTGREKTVTDDSGHPLAAPHYHQLEYVDGLETVYAAADLVIARSGAGTVCELAAIGLPSVLVPLPIGNGEQALNARGLVEAQAALLVDDADFVPAWAREHLPGLLADPERLNTMADAARDHGIRDADETMARLIRQTGDRDD